MNKSYPGDAAGGAAGCWAGDDKPNKSSKPDDAAACGTGLNHHL